MSRRHHNDLGFPLDGSVYIYSTAVLGIFNINGEGDCFYCIA